jgi:hypothetical protein
MSALNDELKDAVAAVRQHGEPIEVYWHENDEPWDQDLHGNWGGDLAGMKDLRRWLKKREPDNRTITIYCRGDSCDVKFESAL